jgi:D-aspartate ligase
MPEDSVAICPVILGSDINAYGIARSFYAEYKVKSILVCKILLVQCRYSRFFKNIILEPSVEEDETFVKTLKTLYQNYAGKEKLLLIPCGDGYAKLLTKHRDQLKMSFVFPNTNHDTFLNLAIKESFYNRCREKDIPHPKTSLCTIESYKTMSLEISFPIVVKPSNSALYWQTSFPGKKKVFITNNQAELDKTLDAIYHSTYTDTLILQEYIPGDDNSIKEVIVYVDKQGEVKFMQFVDIIIEECTPDGLGSIAGATIGNGEAVFDTVKRFLTGSGYHGFAGFDIKYDERDKTYKFFEMNLRLSRTSFIMTGSGYNFSKFLVNDLFLNDMPQEPLIATNDVLYRSIPARLLFKYCEDPKIQEKMRRLIAAGKVCTPFFDSKNDAGFLRCLAYLRNQAGYARKYKKYFHNRWI